MSFKTVQSILVKAGIAASVLVLSSGAALAQVALTAKTTATTLPDGQSVPMWGLACTSSGAAASGGTCASLNPTPVAGWSPPLITVQTGNPLNITLTNSLPVPTSLVIVGQLGGGLGAPPSRSASPVHAAQGTTWPIAGTPGNGNPTFTPPAQNDRVQSFATEVAAGATTALSWTNLKPGTYLIESGTHPSIQGPMGLYGIVVVTDAPNGLAYPTVKYDSDVPLLLSEIDAVQNSAVATAVQNPKFSETMVWSGQPGGCGNPGTPQTSATPYGACYPPAVNYDPRYYLINGVSFDRSHPTASNFNVGATQANGVLLRFVNAGLRMHIPAVVNANMALIAEDGNVLPGVPKVQSEVFLPAGKTYDVLINPVASTAGTYDPATYPVFDRQLSLSTNNQRDGGMQAYIQVNGGGAAGSAGSSSNTPLAAQAVADTYSLVAGNSINIADPAKGVIANDIGVYGVALQTGPTGAASFTLNANGTFSYTPAASTTSDSFSYCANGATNSATLCATVTLVACTGNCKGGVPVANNDIYTSNIASLFQEGAPGVLVNDTDPQGHPLTATLVSVNGGTVKLNADGSFTATPAAPGQPVTFTYTATNSQNSVSNTATATVNFLAGSGLKVNVWDAPTHVSAVAANNSAGGVKITDYRWIIEEDRTFHVDPSATNTGAPVPSLGTNFHTSYMPVVAAGCVGQYACESGQTLQGVAAVCDLGDGVCRTDATQQTPVDPSQVHLDPNKHYYLSILPGDAGNSFTGGAGAPVQNADGSMRQFSIAQDCPSGPGGADFAPGSGTCGHGMGGAPLNPSQATVDVLLQQTPFQTAKISVFVFEDDSPLNGENDAGGGVDILAPKEPGLGGFQIRLWDDAGGTGDATGQMTYDMFNMPLSNSLAGTIDPATGLDACPISPKSTDGLIGMIVTCPTFESDGTTKSPLAGQAVIANMMPGRYGVQADPGADRIGRGEEWLQTNTLDGQKAHDSFIKVGGPAYFQEFGPAGFHVTIGFANPKIINARLAGECAPATADQCTNVVQGTITMARQSRSPDQRLYSSGDNTALSFTQCYVSLGDPDGDDIAFTKCDSNGHFVLSGIPNGNWRITVFDQWNDEIVDGLSTPVALTGSGYDFDQTGGLAKQQWHTDLATTTFLDLNQNGVRDANEPGLTLVATNNRFRDGSYSNFNNTDLNGYANFNELFPLFNWYVLETDTTRFKQTGVHVVYDAGGPADTSGIATSLANTTEKTPVPTNLRVPGAYYCMTADCTDVPTPLSTTTASGSGAGGSTGRVDPPWATTEAWQGFIGSYEIMEFGKIPYQPGENGGIHGEVIYASTRPFDDPTLLIHTSWTPNVPNVTINLYKEDTAADGTQTLTLVDTTKTTSWDDWAQGFRDAANTIPNMSCPGQLDGTGDLYFYTLKDTPNWLDPRNPQGLNGASPAQPLPNDSQFKCYDGLHNFNQVQPAPYDGMYNFPSVTSYNAAGKPATTNCTICVNNPSGDGTQMLPNGKYVVEMILPPGYELVKEEDKNILIGDNYIAPVTQQFGGLANIFILPDQAQVASEYNANNAQNPTNNLGSITYARHEGDTGSVETFWPCVGANRQVPDFISLFPYSQEVAPFAGATRHLCDRKEVIVQDQASTLAKFWVFSSTHVAAHFTGFILDDLSSEFDPFSPQFGEKFAVPNLPVSLKDFAGNEVLRTYADQWGTYNGLNYSTWEVNPPNPTGYAPTMMVACMNDPGTGATPDPYYNPSYSQFCYEIPYMPGQTQYMDTPVVPTASFAEGYNPPDCAYPDATPAVASVTGDAISGGGSGPWVSAGGGSHVLTINALGAVQVSNPAYSGPQATTAPYNQKFLTRNYTFGATAGTVTIGGRTATINSWSTNQIKVVVPTNVPSCSVGSTSTNQSSPLQRNIGNGNQAERCGQLVITAANGQQSIDSVMVTVGGKPPTYVNGENSSYNAVQSAIDKAAPGDLIIVGPGVYQEMLLMWKPVRLQGVGAGSVTINANTHPSGKLDPWRAQVSCLFGLRRNGSLMNDGTNAPFDATGLYSCPTAQRGAVDPLPLEGIVGWDTTLNGNLAELLQEPSLMGAYEGAAITVLAKGETLSIGPGSTGANGTEGDFPAGSVPLSASNRDCRFVANFLCNPSRIDGLSIVNSSQGGGGIYVHAWNHWLEISNNRIHGNAGTLSGGITIGQADSPDPVLSGAGVQLPFLYDHDVRVHNNAVTSNTSYGDELFSSTPSAAGGVTFCTGADYYHFNYNWVCGNLSTGDGGGLVQEGFMYNGDISHNWIVFNQSNNITIPTHGGGIAVLGAGPDGALPGGAPGTECGSTTDIDCAPGLTDGAGPGLVIDSNLIMGNTAESGSGGGIRLELINGNEVTRFPTQPNRWYSVLVQNNIIANNVAGWDGGGVSLQDALVVNFINNTVASNDTTASAGVLFNTLGAPQAGTPPPNCDPTNNPTCAGSAVITSTPQPAGLVTMQNTSNLVAAIAALTNGPGNSSRVQCPAGHGVGGTGGNGLINASCVSYSYPLIENDLFWQNRTFHIQVGGMGTGNLSQQNLVSLIPTLNQSFTGQCVTASTNGTGSVGYWDIGVRGDTGPTSHQTQNGKPASYFTLSPTYSILTSTTGYPGTGNSAVNPQVVSQYCNGSRVPPENGGMGYQVPPGIADATLPNPVFNLTPAATVDEGNNWINMTYGPLNLTNATQLPEMSAAGPVAPGSNVGYGNYGLTGSSTSAIGKIPQGSGNYTDAPQNDYFGNPRKTNHAVDIGAVEYQAPAIAIVNVTPNPLAFGNVVTGSSSTKTLTVQNTGGAAFTGLTVAITGPYSRGTGDSCTTTLAAGQSCTINVVFSPTSTGAAPASTATITGNVAVTGSPVTLTGTGIAAVKTFSFLPNPWSPSQTRNCPGTTIAQRLACAADPNQMFTLTNTGNVTMTGIAVGALSGTNVADYSSVLVLSTCGQAVFPQLLSTVTLAPGASCVVTVGFRPLTSESTGTKNATVSVVNSFGTATSTLSGKAN